jgi:hypothetical protein
MSKVVSITTFGAGSSCPSSWRAASMDADADAQGDPLGPGVRGDGSLG